MATTTLTPLPLATYFAGTYAPPAVAVPLGITQAVSRIDLAHLVSLTLDLQLSFASSQDNGLTWTLPEGPGLNLPRSGCALAVPGPGIIDRQGILVPFLELVETVPNPTNTQRQVRVTAVLSETFDTAVTVILS